jgi:anhydro-N-acetylmuramic acid kinase
MSGTSLDGLDVAYCEFERREQQWRYQIIYAETKKYDRKWKRKLSGAFKTKKKEREKLDVEYGKFIGKQVLKFTKKYKASADFIASHGHTIFHQPHKGITLQIGSGKEIASVCGMPVLFDFRAGDVALGGQGAPLVPLVDKILFSKYDYCLNLGGFANISFNNKRNNRIAFDICPVNIVLNELANKLGKEFDKGGRIASKGRVHRGLLEKLNALPFYSAVPPKSLGREWVENKFLPSLSLFKISTQDKLRTVVEHVAIQIAAAVDHSSTAHFSLFITGGGAYNTFLIKRISFYTKIRIVLPDDKTIQFKEAMAFAFLAVLKMQGQINILKSVTGARRDSSGGKMVFPDQKAESSS